MVIMGQIGRYLGVQDFGVFNYTISFILIFTVVSQLGLPQIIMKYTLQASNDLSLVFGSALLARLVGITVGLGGLFVAINLLSPSTEIRHLLYIFSCRIAFEFFDVFDFYCKALQKSKLSVLARSISFLISATLKLSLIFSGQGDVQFFLMAEAFEFLLTSLLYVVFYYRAFGDPLKIRVSWPLSKQMIRDSLPVLIAASAGMVYLRMDQIMIREMAGNRQTGLYSVAVRVSELAYFLPSIFGESIFPALAKKHREGGKDFNRFLERNYVILALIAIAVFLFVLIFGRLIIGVLFGSDFSEAYGIMSIHAASAIFLFMTTQTVKCLLLDDLQRLNSYRTITGAALNILLNAILIPKYNAYGAAVSSLVAHMYVGLFSNLWHQKARKYWWIQLHAYISLINPQTYKNLYKQMRQGLKH